MLVLIADIVNYKLRSCIKQPINMMLMFDSSF